MSAFPADSVRTPACGPETGVADVVSFPLGGRDGGDQDTRLRFEMEITDWGEPDYSNIRDAGTVVSRLVRLETVDKREPTGRRTSVFDFRKIIPETLEWDIPVDMRPPLGTPPKGYNDYVTIQMAKAGMHPRIISTNLARGFSLLHDAQAALLIYNQDDLESQGNPVAESGVSLFSGYSMGIMAQFAQLGLAPHMGREVPLTVGLDPSAAKKIKITPAEALKFGFFALQEGLEIPQIVYESIVEEGICKTAARLRHLIRTFSPDPGFLLNSIGKVGAIASGETKDSIANIPPEAAMVIHSFRGSIYNDGPAYADLLSSHPNARIVHEDGRHLSGAYISAIRSVVAKTAHGQRLISEGVPASELVDALSYSVLKSSR